MSNMAEGTRLAGEIPVDSIASPTAIVGHGHESLIAQPSTFLLPRGQNRAMVEKPLTALDRDQQQGLVSGVLSPSCVGALKLRYRLAVCGMSFLRDMARLIAGFLLCRNQSESSSEYVRVTTFFPSPSDSSSSTPICS